MADLIYGVAYTRTFLMIDSADHITGAAGRAPVVLLSKAGGALAAAAGTVTEIGSGLYKIALTAADTNTIGDLALHATATSCDPTDVIDQVCYDGSASEVETGVSMIQALRYILASVSGKVAGYPAGPGVFYAPDGSTIRLTVTSDNHGNRSAVSRSG
jgi:hypothetical protein